jgi:hypothetical protein
VVTYTVPRVGVVVARTNWHASASRPSRLCTCGKLLEHLRKIGADQTGPRPTRLEKSAWTPARQRDELIDKSCNNYRRIVGCVLSEDRRVHPVIVGWSTPQIALFCPDPSMIIPDACSLPHGLGQLPDKLGGRA